MFIDALPYLSEVWFSCFWLYYYLDSGGNLLIFSVLPWLSLWSFLSVFTVPTFPVTHIVELPFFHQGNRDASSLVADKRNKNNLMELFVWVGHLHYKKQQKKPSLRKTLHFPGVEIWMSSVLILFLNKELATGIFPQKISVWLQTAYSGQFIKKLEPQFCSFCFPGYLLLKQVFGWYITR